MFAIIDGIITGFFTSIRFTNHEDVPKHLHGNLEILVVTEGSINVTLEDVKYTLTKGTGIFIPPFASHSLDYDENHEFYALMFTKDIVPYFYEFFKNHEFVKPIFPVSEENITNLYRYLPNVKHSDNYFHSMAVLGPIICEIYSKCVFVPTKNKLTDSFYSALEYMNDHSTEKITRDSVAKAIGIHPTTLSNCFSKYSYSNFNAILNRMRCSHAVSAMQNNLNLSFAEIAFSCGFGSIRSFNRAFVEVYGTTPSNFKLNNKTT